MGILRRLCGAFQQLPDSCLIRDGLRISDEIPFATCASSDLWKGDWRGKGVAVKLLRFAASDNRAKITKVSSAFGLPVFIQSQLTRCGLGKRFCKEMVLWKQLRHPNLLPFHGAYMASQFGMVSPWMENGNIVRFTRKNPDFNRLRLVRCGQQPVT